MVKDKWPNGLRAAMQEKGIGVTRLGELIGESKQNVDRWRKGDHKLLPPVAARIAPFLDTTAAKLLLISHQFQAPVNGKVGAGGTITNADSDTGEHRQRIDLVAGEPEGAQAVEISGESLGNSFDGWFAIYPGPLDFHDGLYGRLCVLETTSGQTFIKWVERTRKKGVKLVSGDGSVQEDGVDLKWIAPVIGLRPPG